MQAKRHRGFDHPHQNAGRQAVAGDIRNVGEGVATGCDKVHQIASDVFAGNRSPVRFNVYVFTGYRRDEYVLDGARNSPFPLEALARGAAKFREGD